MLIIALALACDVLLIGLRALLTPWRETRRQHEIPRVMVIEAARGAAGMA